MKIDHGCQSKLCSCFNNVAQTKIKNKHSDLAFYWYERSKYHTGKILFLDHVMLVITKHKEAFMYPKSSALLLQVSQISVPLLQDV